MSLASAFPARDLSAYHRRLQRIQLWQWQGEVLEAGGLTIESRGPNSSVGECLEIVDRAGRVHLAEVVGFRSATVLSMPVNSPEGIRFGDVVAALGKSPEIDVGPSLIGRVLNALGEPIDAVEGGAGRAGVVAEGRSGKTLNGDRPLNTGTSGLSEMSATTDAGNAAWAAGRVTGQLTGKLNSTEPRPLAGAVRAALTRVAIRSPLGTGIRVIDSLLTVGRGQRIGIFGGSGVGKSTLIGMMTRNTAADITVVGLVGERGREVGEFLEEALGEEGRKRAVVLVSTSDESPLMRIRAALSATTVAEYFAAQGKHVLLVLDSLTRFAMAAREVGLAAGEPATAKGYTPSVFTKLAKLVERAGNFQTGSITAFYTVLMEGDDQQDPLVDAVRSLLDGHVVLSRSLAAEGWYPPVDVLDSISRLMPQVADAGHRENAALVRRLLAAYARSEDLVRVGAYKPGADEDLDRALRCRLQLRDFLAQDAAEHIGFADCLAQFAELAGQL